MAQLTIGLIGCGRLAELGYLPALAAVRGVRLGAVADPDLVRRQRLALLAGRLGEPVTTHPSAADLLERAHVDALVLATPADAHLPDAELAAGAGLPVLVEKPPAGDAAGAARLAGLDPPPWIAFNRRFEPGNAQLRAAVPSDGPVHVQLEIRYRRRGWAPHTVADDALLDLGPHLVDLARWLLATEIRAVAGAAVTPTRAGAELRTTGATVRIDCATDRAHLERVELRDPSGRVIARRRTGGLPAGVLARLPGGRGPHPLTASLTRQLTAFADAVHGGPALGLGTAADGLAVMQVIDAVRACAAADGRPVALPEAEPAQGHHRGHDRGRDARSEWRSPRPRAGW
ncbi:MAG: Gfo/Idh/MocA family oxidoreductase [Egibacteraceae bacterium]